MYDYENCQMDITRALEIQDIRLRFLKVLDEAENVAHNAEAVTDRGDIYTYANAHNIIPPTKELLKKHDFYLTQNIRSSSETDYMLITLIRDRKTNLPAVEGIYMPIVYTSDIRKLGAEITCARRYSILLALGIVTQDVDTEGTLAPKTKSLEHGIDKPKKTKGKKAKAKISAEEFVGELTPEKIKEGIKEDYAFDSPKEELLFLLSLLEKKNLIHKLKDLHRKNLEDFREGKKELSPTNVQSGIKFLQNILEENLNEEPTE